MYLDNNIYKICVIHLVLRIVVIFRRPRACELLATCERPFALAPLLNEEECPLVVEHVQARPVL